MSNIQAQIDALNLSVVILNNSVNNITGNSLSNYNLINHILLQQSNINNSIYNGTGNVVTGNLQVNSNANIIGNLIVDNETLYVDSLNNKIGILNTNPQYALDISGNANISRNAFIKNSIGINTNNTSANLHIEGNVFMNGNLNVDNGTLWIDTLNDRIGILNTNPQYTLDIKGSANISSNVIVNNDLTILGNLFVSGFDYNYYTVNNSNLTITQSLPIRKFNFVQRQTLSTATSSSTYNSLRLVYSTNINIIVIARISGHLYYNDTDSSGIFQENKIIIESNNSGTDTSVSNISNGTPLVVSKGSSGTWTSCNMSTTLDVARECIINIIPVFTGTQSTEASSITIDWFITLTNSSANNLNINTIQFYAGN